MPRNNSHTKELIPGSLLADDSEVAKAKIGTPADATGNASDVTDNAGEHLFDGTAPEDPAVGATDMSQKLADPAEADAQEVADKADISAAEEREVSADGDGESDKSEERGDGESEAAETSSPRDARSRIYRIATRIVLPVLVVLLAGAAGYLKWQDNSTRASFSAATSSVQAATESTIAMLSYRPDNAEKDLVAAGNRMTGNFRNDYLKLIKDVVIPGANQKQITSVATVPAAAAVSATENHAVVLVFVNQSIVMGTDPPTNTVSSVRVTLDRSGDRWLISQFDPV